MLRRSTIICSLFGLFLSIGCDAPVPTVPNLTDGGNSVISNPTPNHLITGTSDTPPGTVDKTPPTAQDADATQQLKLIMRGMNVGNFLDQPGNPSDRTQSQCPVGGPPQEGQATHGPLKGWMFEAISRAGFDHVRVTINWNCHTHSTVSNPYEIDAAWFDRIDWVIAHVLTRNMAAVIDMHNFWDYFNGLSSQRDKFISLWTQIAAHYQNYPKQLFFEILNEPPYGFDETTWGTDLSAAIQIVRASNPNRTIIYGGTDFNKAYTLPRLMQYLPTNDANLIGTDHYYRPYCFTHPGQTWDCPPHTTTSTNVHWPVLYPDDVTGDAGDAAAAASENKVKTDFASTVSTRQQIGRPIYVGEFGADASRDLVSRGAYIAFVARTAEQNGIAWSNWSLTDTPFDAWNTTVGWYPDVITALMPDYVEPAN